MPDPLLPSGKPAKYTAWILERDRLARGLRVRVWSSGRSCDHRIMIVMIISLRNYKAGKGVKSGWRLLPWKGTLGAGWKLGSWLKTKQDKNSKWEKKIDWQKKSYKKRRSFVFGFIKRLVCSSTFKDPQLQRFAFFFSSSRYRKTSSPFLSHAECSNPDLALRGKWIEVIRSKIIVESSGNFERWHTGESNFPLQTVYRF